MIKTINKRGQSIVEYSLIAFLVLTGIVWMGPYVLRSINGYFKLWDEGIYDSFTENPVQAPAFPLQSTCVCTPGCTPPGQTPAPGANPIICSYNAYPCVETPGWYYYYINCTPLGCNPGNTSWCCTSPGNCLNT